MFSDLRKISHRFVKYLAVRLSAGRAENAITHTSTAYTQYGREQSEERRLGKHSRTCRLRSLAQYAGSVYMRFVVRITISRSKCTTCTPCRRLRNGNKRSGGRC